MKKLIRIVVFLLFSVLTGLTSLQAQVRISETTIVIPTYQVGEPETTPLFYTPEGYQGAQLRIYPYPYIGKLSDKKLDKIYKAIILENEYIKICVLPELGGRLYYAQDKSNGYDFIYRNTVIKPALIGMTGAWISGGVEWNVPHHHRASTFMPVDYKLVENTDGSKTVWVGEFEKRSQTRWCVGLTVYPGKTYVEATLRYLNVTPVVNSFLFWANAAVHANQNYQVVFPPDVEKAVFHSKVAFTDFPVSNTHYQGNDFTKGVDVSWWKNTASPTSFFAWDTEKDFMAGIDHGKNAGTAIVGNHYIFSGKKFWNWGNNDVQRMWDQMLTDTDGPYLEMMTGMYSDNQPDYSWNSPYGLKNGTMYYFPFKNLSSVKEANKNAALNIELKNGKALVQLYATSRIPSCRLIVFQNGKEIATRQIDLDPILPFSEEIKVPNNVKIEELSLMVLANDNSTLIEYAPTAKKNSPEPEKYVAPKNPSEISRADQLYMEGLRLEQFSNSSYDPLLYYKEALKRDSNHILTNTQLGIHYLKALRYNEAQKYLEHAVASVTHNYTPSKNGEPLYYLGVCLFYQGNYKKAYDILYKASWNTEWASQSYYLLALIDCLNTDYNAAIDKLSESISANTNNVEAINLMAIILRRNGESELAAQTMKEAENIDPLSLTSAFEQYQIDKKNTGMVAANKLRAFYRDEADNYLETASRYLIAGFYSDAVELLHLATSKDLPKTSSNPLIYYYLGYCYFRTNELADAANWYKKASTMNPNISYPYGNASLAVLNNAAETNPLDASAHYLLGNLWCNDHPELAFAEWEKSVSINKTVAGCRNLAFLQANYYNKPSEAIANLDKAFELGSTNPMHLLERDVYAEYAGVDPALRFSFLEKNASITAAWDKTELRHAELLIFAGKYNEAIEILKAQHFFIAEITTLNPHIVWTNAHLARGIQYLQNNETEKAIADFQEIFRFPRNLEIARDSKIVLANYWLGKSYLKKGDAKKAKEYFTLMANNKETSFGWGATGNGLLPFYQALAWLELGDKAKANAIFNQLISKGNELLNTKYHEASVDKSVNIRQSRRMDKAEGYLYLGLGNKGLGKMDQANEMFKKAFEIYPSFFDVKLAGMQ